MDVSSPKQDQLIVRFYLYSQAGDEKVVPIGALIRRWIHSVQ